MFSLKDKKILITGSTDGLGKVLVGELADLGARVIIHGRNQEKINKTLADLKKEHPQKVFSSVICDFGQQGDWAKNFSQIDSLDVLVNNAGIWYEGETIKMSQDKIFEMVNVNLASYLFLSRLLLPTLLESEFAQILNVISVAGFEVPKDYFHTVYSATKYALQGFSEAMAKEFENKNLRVMGFYPGGMATEFFRKAGEDYDKNEPWMFDPKESVEAIIFMLTRNKKVNAKRLDLINHLQK